MNYAVNNKGTSTIYSEIKRANAHALKPRGQYKGVLMDTVKDKPVLVTGATGYVAGRLIPLLLASGYQVRAMGRSVSKMADRPWGHHPQVELVRADIQDPESVEKATAGCGAVYYLVHSMISQKGRYRSADRTAARNMVRAAERSKAEHIIYLGGLGDVTHKNISRHLISRNEVGKILQEGPVPVTVLRAAMIIGSGSASFEILRYLAERLPVMVTPKWVSMPTQPIAITNVLEYLKGCLEHPETRGKTFDIGGPDVLAYRDLFKIFARLAGVPVPRMIPVPWLTPKLSSLWIHLVTPVPAAIARPLTEGLSLPTICTENSIQTIIPQDLLSCRQAIALALDRVRQEQVDTCWADAGRVPYPEWMHFGDSSYSGGTILSCGYRAKVKGSPEKMWEAVQRIGGSTGYYGADMLWKLRGLLDIFTGGVGLTRGRRSSKEIRVGDALDFWRVLEVSPNRKLLLYAEMKLPGEGLLDISVAPLSGSFCELSLMARFLPRGLAGLAYWYVLYPFHQYVYTQMIKGMVESCGLNLAGAPEQFRYEPVSTCRLPED